TMDVSARHAAMTNSSNPKSVARLNTSAMGSTKITTQVRRSARTSEPRRYLFRHLSLKLPPLFLEIEACEA
ncbi:MAG: hypothetical protein PT940_07345, partial [Clostridiales bacterium]|nr:hypothetical protein [Clostridiales bacterium]